MGGSHRLSIDRNSAGLGSSWKQVRVTIPNTSRCPSVQLLVRNEGNGTATYWVDDFRWTFSEEDQRDSSPYFDAVFVPEDRTGMKFTAPSHRFRGRVLAPRDTGARLEFHLKDLSRNTVTQARSPVPVTLRRGIHEETVTLSGLRNGCYLLVLNVRDRKDGSVLAVARERFAVMADLSRVPKPNGFISGTHYGVTLFSGIAEYNWRGNWDSDEYFKMNYQTGLRVQRHRYLWYHLEPRRGKYNWYLDNTMEAARRHGCEILLTFPCYPQAYVPGSRHYLHTPEDHWLHKTSIDLSEFLRQHNERWMKNYKRGTTVLGPDPKALAATCEMIARRYRGVVNLLEYSNEVGAICLAEGVLEYVAKPAYPAFKRGNPDLVCFLGLNRDSDNYAGKFLKLGGNRYSDGYIFHPYSGETIHKESIRKAIEYERRAREHELSGHKLHIGQNECFGIAQTGSYVGWDVFQRTLLDWGMGFRVSNGFVYPTTVATEAGPPQGFRWLGPRCPSFAAVVLNASHYLLPGGKGLGIINKDPHLLIAKFETRESDGRTGYAVALSARYDPGRSALVEVDLKGIRCRTYDQWGAPTDRGVSRPLLVDHRGIYVKSADERLLRRFEAADVRWAYAIDSEYYRIKPAANLAEAEEQHFGTKERVRGAFIGEWRVEVSSAPPVDPVRVDYQRTVDDPFTNGLTVELTGAQRYVCARATLYHDRDERVPFHISWYGAKMLTVYHNGAEVFSTRGSFDGTFGQDFRSFSVPVRSGLDHLVVIAACSGKRFGLKAKPFDTPEILGGCIDRARAPGVDVTDGREYKGKLFQEIADIGPTRIMRYSSFVRAREHPQWLVSDVMNRGSWSIGKGNDTGCLLFEFRDKKAYCVNGYAWKSASGFGRRGPDAATFSGSQDGRSWTRLHRLDPPKKTKAPPKNRPQLVRFRLDNEKKYTYYRLEMRGPKGKTALTNVELLEFE